MTNIAITSLCNRSCRYCFAGSVANEPRHMDPAVFEQALDCLHRSGITQARLLGGEPTIHPRFSDFVSAVEGRGFDLLLFSNGRMPRKSIDRLHRFPEDRLSILINTDPLIFGKGKNQDRFRQVCRAFGPRLHLGYTIDSPGADLGFLLDAVSAFGLAPQIRLGIAHPSPGAENFFLHPRHYRAVGERIGHFLRRARKRGIRIELDCGFVPCMFAEADLGLLQEIGQLPGLRCNPLPDLLPDGRLIPCYPLARVAGMNMDADSRCAEVQDLFTRKLAHLRQAGIFRCCNDCILRSEGRCSGGCLAVALQRLRHVPFAVPVPGRLALSPQAAASPCRGDEPSDCAAVGRPGPAPPISWTIPYIDQPPSFWKQIYSLYGNRIQEVYCPLPGMVPSGRPVQASRYLDGFLRSSPLPVGIIVNPVILPQPVDRIAPFVIEKLRNLQNIGNLQGVSVADYGLALRIKEALPEISLTASVLMDVAKPQQALLLGNLCDRLVPSSRIMRDKRALQAVAEAFCGRIRLLVNEACVPDCLCRTQHFYEMAYSVDPPLSLCRRFLDRRPWMRLTGAWVLPQHLHLFDGIADEMKLAGRATLQNPEHYLQVLDAYMTGSPLTPDRIGGGPASPLHPVKIDEGFYRATFTCGKRCDSCSICRDYFDQHGMR